MYVSLIVMSPSLFLISAPVSEAYMHGDFETSDLKGVLDVSYPLPVYPPGLILSTLALVG